MIIRPPTLKGTTNERIKFFFYKIFFEKKMRKNCVLLSQKCGPHCCMFKKSCLIPYSDLLYQMDQDFLDSQYRCNEYENNGFFLSQFWQINFLTYSLILVNSNSYRSDSSAAWEASASFCVAVASLSSLLSRSSSSSWMRRFKAATSPSAYTETQDYFSFLFQDFSSFTACFQLKLS